MTRDTHDSLVTSGARIRPQDPETVQALIDDAPEAARSNQARAEAILGELDADAVPAAYDNEADWGFTFTGILAHRPETFKLWWAEEGAAFGEGTLDRGFKELLAAVIAHRRGAAICIAWHVTSAQLEDIEPERFAIAANFDERKEELPERERVAIDFAVRSVEEPTSINDEDVTQLRDHGYTEGEIVELVTTAGTAAKFANYAITFDI